MLAATVYNAVISTLKNDPTLSKYVKQVFKGLRYDIEPESLPCIMIEPTTNNEISLDMNTVKDIWMGLDVMAYSYAASNPEKSIVGDAMYKGVYDIENDIRACLQSSYTLGDKVIDIKFQPTTFGYKDYPIRGFNIPIKILYRQTNSV
jgi:hypothetical protein